MSFNWLAKELLHSTVHGYVILDRDYKSDELQRHIAATLAEGGLTAHFWQRHEVENYLLVPSAVQRLTGMPSEQVAEVLRDETLALADVVLFGYVSALTDDATVQTRDPRKLVQHAADCRSQWWSDEQERLSRCPGKELLGRLNDCLAARNYGHASVVNLARELRPSEISDEIVELLNRIEP